MAKNRLLAYVDLLGTSASVDALDQMEARLDILREFELLRRNSSSKAVLDTEGTAVGFLSKPEISSFSDHIVISIP